MPGYANRVVTLRFDELAEDGDDIHVVMRNPKLLTAAELTENLNDAEVNPETGRPVDMAAARDAMCKKIARLVIGWRVYDATLPYLDENGAPTDGVLLESPATGELVAKLPAEILTKLIDVWQGAANPQ